MNKARIQIAKPDIIKFFDDIPSKVFKNSDIAEILTEKRDFWRLTQKTFTSTFIKFLVQHAKLARLDFPFPYRNEHRYVWGNVPLLEVLLTLKQNAYFTHYTATRMHGLTEQVPKTIYLNHEQPPHAAGAELQQGRIDAAFKRRARVSQNIIDFGDVRICLVNGMHTNQLGVIEEQVTYEDATPVKVRLSNIERTLIDITVRPAYAGGVFEVLKAFRLAKDRASVNRMAAMYKDLNYVYPYHQAIGFYLERSGYKPSTVDLFRKFPRNFDFYLAHEIGKTEYIKEWRLHVPQGF